MKFQLIVEATEKRLVLIPENPAEAVLLGTICDPNETSMNSDAGGRRDATVTVKPTDDRIPYRKVKELHILL